MEYPKWVIRVWEVREECGNGPRFTPMVFVRDEGVGLWTANDAATSGYDSCDGLMRTDLRARLTHLFMATNRTSPSPTTAPPFLNS